MKQFKTIPEIFLNVTDEYANSTRPVYLQKSHNQGFAGTSYKELRQTVECLSLGLQELGMSHGDRVGIVSENRLEWVMSDFAITSAGAIDVPVFPTLMPKQLAYIFSNCEASIIIVSNAFQLNKIKKVWDEIPSLKYVVVMLDKVVDDDPRVLHLADVIEMGKRKTDELERRRRFIESAQQVREDDLCTIIYTSGTTGNPKGVMLTHKNLISNIIAAYDVVRLDDTDIFLSFLPMCHAYERIAGYLIAFAYGASTAFAESIDTVRANLQEVRPTIMTGVPRLFEKIYNGVIANSQKQSPSKQKIFNWALKVGKQYIDGMKSGGAGLATKLQYTLAYKLVFSKVHAIVGDRFRFFVSGGGALPDVHNEFFRMCKITIIEGYGLTETSPVLTVTRFEDNEIGTVGKPIFNVEINIAPDGEILARGPNIMRGYWRDPQATAETINEQGWLATGDIGFINERGNLKITDRKKNIFVSSGGKNIAPVPIENEILQSKYIDQIVLIGEKRDFCIAIAVPDFTAIEEFAKAQSISFSSREELVNNESINREIMRDMNILQRDHAKYERVRKVILLPKPFTVEDGDMTPTLKIKRKVVEQKYAKEINHIYEMAEHHGEHH
jgi:long-chain acyl-CoA synthetase